MNLILFDGAQWNSLLPLTYTRPVSEIRLGILTFKERWDILLNTRASYRTEKYLQEKYILKKGVENLFINPAFFPSEELVEKIGVLSFGQSIYQDQHLVAYLGNKLNETEISKDKNNLNSKLLHIVYAWDLFTFNAHALKFDFNLLTKNRQSEVVSKSNGVINPENIFLEKGAKVEYSILNASQGPIYIGENAEVMEGSMIRGGFALCKESKLNMGAKIYGATTIGPYCKVGGEINNSIFLGYSNKGHDGFIGNSVIGEWCNLGADTNNSNLKNNYSEVKMWSIAEGENISTGLQFCGLIMADHSKSAIGSRFNTGTTVGVSVNFFKSGFPENHIPSFSWEGEKREKYNIEKSILVAEKVMQRRTVKISPLDINILKHIAGITD